MCSFALPKKCKLLYFIGCLFQRRKTTVRGRLCKPSGCLSQRCHEKVRNEYIYIYIYIYIYSYELGDSRAGGAGAGGGASCRRACPNSIVNTIITFYPLPLVTDITISIICISSIQITIHAKNASMFVLVLFRLRFMLRMPRWLY